MNTNEHNVSMQYFTQLHFGASSYVFQDDEHQERMKEVWYLRTCVDRCFGAVEIRCFCQGQCQKVSGFLRRVFQSSKQNSMTLLHSSGCVPIDAITAPVLFCLVLATDVRKIGKQPKAIFRIFPTSLLSNGYLWLKRSWRSANFAGFVAFETLFHTGPQAAQRILGPWP